jgi:cephalosporin-C deacetylase-like acetyl esterase
MDKSLFGMRVQDVIRTVDYALSRASTDPSSVQVIGVGNGALWALYAAALDSRIQATICHGGLVSYRSLTSVDRYVYGADIFIPDVLLHFDLPHVAAAVAGRRLVLLSPVDAMEHPVDILAAQGTYRLTREVYSKAEGANKFQIAAVDPDRGLAEQYLNLLI